jgi:hypothetical protein
MQSSAPLWILYLFIPACFAAALSGMIFVSPNIIGVIFLGMGTLFLGFVLLGILYFDIGYMIFGHALYYFRDRTGNSHFHKTCPKRSVDKKRYLWEGKMKGTDKVLSLERRTIDSPIIKLAFGGWFRKTTMLNRYWWKIKHHMKTETLTLISKKTGIKGENQTLGPLSYYQALTIIKHNTDVSTLVRDAIELQCQEGSLANVQKALADYRITLDKSTEYEKDLREERDHLQSQVRDLTRLAEHFAMSHLRMLALMQVLRNTLGRSKHAQRIRELTEHSLDTAPTHRALIASWKKEMAAEQKVWEDAVRQLPKGGNLIQAIHQAIGNDYTFRLELNELMRELDEKQNGPVPQQATGT